MLKYDGGGHENAGTCQVKDGDAERVPGELVAGSSPWPDSACPSTMKDQVG